MAVACQMFFVLASAVLTAGQPLLGPCSCVFGDCLILGIFDAWPLALFPAVANPIQPSGQCAAPPPPPYVVFCWPTPFELWPAVLHLKKISGQIGFAVMGCALVIASLWALASVVASVFG